MRHLPHVVVATALVLLLPSLGVYFLEEAGVLSSILTSTLASIALSVALAQVMSAAWMRHSGSRDLVFGDLMLWGWIRRWRMERRFSDAIHLLGLDRRGRSTREIFMSPQRQASILTELASALEAGDPFTHGHSRRVTRYANMIARTMNLDPETIDKIRTAAAVHDVGKIDTPSSILNKPGSLTANEFEIMKLHPVTGAAMVERFGSSEITAIVRHHHERFDGRGYPERLRGDEIPLGARVIAVADTFDAITSARPYRKGRSHAEAIEIIKRASGNQLDPDVVDAFLAYYSGKRSLALWMSLSAALQRIVGGFGNWVQHAQAGGLSGATASVGAAVVMTAAAAGAFPGASVIRALNHHDNPNAVVASQDASSAEVEGESPGAAGTYKGESADHASPKNQRSRSELKGGNGKGAHSKSQRGRSHPKGATNPNGTARGKSLDGERGASGGDLPAAAQGKGNPRGPKDAFEPVAGSKRQDSDRRPEHVTSKASDKSRASERSRRP